MRYLYRDRIWKLRLAKIRKPVTCTIIRIVADKIQATYLGPRVVGSQSKSICRPGQKSTISISNTKTETETTSVSKSRSTTNSFEFGVTVGVKVSVGLTDGVISLGAEKSIEFSSSYGHSSTNTLQNSKAHSISDSVTHGSAEELTGPQGSKKIFFFNHSEF